MVFIVSWNYYIPDCPADLEVTDSELIAITTRRETIEEFINRYIRQTCEVNRVPFVSQEEFEEENYGYFTRAEVELDEYVVGRLKMIKEIQSARNSDNEGSNIRQ